MCARGRMVTYTWLATATRGMTRLPFTGWSPPTRARLRIRRGGKKSSGWNPRSRPARTRSRRFGGSTDLSADGQTFVVVAPAGGDRGPGRRQLGRRAQSIVARAGVIPDATTELGQEIGPPAFRLNYRANTR